MIRKKHKLRERLEAGELRRLDAEVLEVHHIAGSGGLAGGIDVGTYRVHVRVEPPGEEAFEASFNYVADFPGLSPHEGGKLPVAYDPDDRGDVIWDEQTARSADAKKAALDRERRGQKAAERREQGLPPLEADDTPDPDLIAKLQELEARKDRGELNDWEFRVARSEIFKEKGF